jgi:hypothetical protein
MISTLPPQRREGTAPAPVITFDALTPQRAILFPLACVAALVALVALPAVREREPLLWTFLGVAAVLAVWAIEMAVSAKHSYSLRVVLRPQHYLQACAQGAVLLYWGWYWRELYSAWYLIAAQLVFAYAFDMLIVWSRRREYTLGFGQFPVIFSINLFLWFKPDWFYLQFLMIALGFAGKEFIRWDKDGQSAHVFNPSSFPLGVFSLALLLTGKTSLSWGQEIATTLFYPPHIYLFIFLIGLPGQLLFGVTTMTMSAVVTMYGVGLAYFAATGTYFFVDQFVPIAVFLGMHLLFTDPSTSPRTELGRILFGALYAVSVMTLYTVLGLFGVPTFYDKLLAVPIMNLTIRAIDRVVRSGALRWLDPAALGRRLAPFGRRMIYVGVWVGVFVLMSVRQGVGDTSRGHHIPFWRQACSEQRRNACRALTTIELRNCANGSGWACNEVGVTLSGVNDGGNDAQARQLFGRACALGFDPGCANSRAASASELRTAEPALDDYRILLREGKGPLPNLSAPQLYDLACRQGWSTACGRQPR